MHQKNKQYVWDACIREEQPQEAVTLHTIPVLVRVSTIQGRNIMGIQKESSQRFAAYSSFVVFTLWSLN